MFRVTERAVLDHPAEVVWEYLIAFEQVPLWEHGVLEVRWLGATYPKVGDKISARRLYAGRESRLEGEIIEYDDGHFAAMRLSGGPLEAVEVRYSVERLGDQRSLVTYHGSGSLRGPLRLLHPLLSVVGRAEARGNLARLGRRIDSGVPPTSGIHAG